MTGGPSPFEVLAPRLYRAHRAELARLAAEQEARRGARQRVLELEALVAHRELQELRAGAVLRARGYVARRAAKTAQARRALAHATRRLAELEASW